MKKISYLRKKTVEILNLFGKMTENKLRNWFRNTFEITELSKKWKKAN